MQKRTAISRTELLRTEKRTPIQLKAFSFSNIYKKTTKRSPAELKQLLFEKAKNSNNGVNVSSAGREEIQTIIKELEQTNKINTISKSAKFNGLWKLLYTTNDGSSAGKFGPFVGKVTQDIRLSDQQYVNNVNFLDNNVRLSLLASWDVLEPSKVRVNFLTISFHLFNKQVFSRPFPPVSGVWRMTFLDDNMRILWAQGGKNTTKENVYVLYKD